MIEPKALAGLVLVTAGLSVVLGPVVMTGILSAAKSMWEIVKRRSPTDHTTDQRAPDGFADHAKVIVEASEGAPGEIRISYMLDALTESDTLRKEVARLRELTK